MIIKTWLLLAFINGGYWALSDSYKTEADCLSDAAVINKAPEKDKAGISRPAKCFPMIKEK
jgi:hypothetical protein